MFSSPLLYDASRRMTQPTLTTARLVLRPFRLSDAPVVQRLAGDPAVAITTLNIPHPYPDGAAEAWIATHEKCWTDGTNAVFAITEQGELRGAIGLHINAAHKRGELGYWIGTAYWRRGLATESSEAMLRLAFVTLGLNRVQASFLPHNAASGRVLEKIGMAREGLHRERYLKGNAFQDVVECAILRREWEARHAE